MKHIKRSWLLWLNVVLAVIDVAIVATDALFEILKVTPELKVYWGTSHLILLLACVHLLIAVVVFPLTSRKNTVIPTYSSYILFGLLLLTLIDATNAENIYYNIALALYLFLLGTAGILLPLVSVGFIWLAFLYSIINYPILPNQSITEHFFVFMILTICSLGGWLVARHFYAAEEKDNQESLADTLHREQAKSSIILESITDGVLVMNNSGLVQLINISGATMLGWSKDEATGLNYRSLFSLVNKAGDTESTTTLSEQDVIARALKTGQPSQHVLEIETHHQRRLYIDIVASPMYEEGRELSPTSKRVVGVIAVLRDVDKQKREEEQRSDFISTASHEMRTPVASIQGFLELVLNPKVCSVDDKAKGYLTKAYEATKHLGELFQDLLTVSKTDDGRLNNNPKIVNIHDFLTEITEAEKGPAAHKGLKLTYDEAGENHISPLMHVNVDPDRLREVMLNLIENAIKYTPQGSITVGATLSDDRVVLKVSDTGTGIAEEDIPHLFQKFYRVDNSQTREIGGTGLGLYICRQIVEMMRGKIWVESTLGSGSTFFVELPRVAPETVAANQS